MTGSYEQLGAAREELALLLGDLSYASGHLEEAATVWRRGGHPGGPDLEPGFHKRLRDAADRLVSTLHALVDAGAGQPPNLAFSAVAQLSALENDIACAVKGVHGSSPDLGDGALLSAVNIGLQRARMRLWSLISHLVTIKEWSWNGQPGGAGENFLVTFG